MGLCGPNIISNGSLHFVATCDFTGAGLADFLFQDGDGEIDIVGTGVIGTVGNPEPSWHVIGSNTLANPVPPGTSNRTRTLWRRWARLFVVMRLILI